MTGSAPRWPLPARVVVPSGQGPARSPDAGIRLPQRLSALATAGHLVGAQLIVAAASLVINAMAARTMGPGGRGQLALLLQITYLATMLAMAGIDRSYPATVPLQRSIRNAAVDTLRLVAPSTAVVLAVVVPLGYALGSAAPSSRVLTAVGAAAVTAAMVAVAALRTGSAAAGSVRSFVLATVIGQGTLVATAVLLTAAGVKSSDLWLLAYGAALGIGAVVAWALLRRTSDTEPEAPHSLSPARWLGLRLLPAAVASMVMLRADRLLLPWLGSYEQLGLYIVVATLGELVSWPVQCYVDAQAPRWHQRFLSGELQRGGPLLIGAGYGAAAGLALVVAGHLLVVPVFGATYRESTVLLTPLAVGAACYCVSRIAIGLTVAAGRARAALAADIPAMVVALAAYLVLIPRHGALGAAIGSAIAYGVGALLAVPLCLRAPAPARPTRSADRLPWKLLSRGGPA